MQDFLAQIEPLLANIYVKFGAAALGGFLIGWVLRGLRSNRPAAPEYREPPVASPPAALGEPLAASPGVHGEALSILAGITPPLFDKLSAEGVTTVGELWVRGRDDDGLHALADALQLEDFVLRKWVNAADLLRLPGVTPILADALIQTGVRTVEALAGENPDRVQNKLSGYEEKTASLGRVPVRADVVTLIEAAADLHSDTA